MIEMMSNITVSFKSKNIHHFDIDLFLLSSVPYPVSSNKPMTIKKFCEQLPIPTSHATPLVFYTFSTVNTQEIYPQLHVPSIRPIRQYNDVAAACEWSKDMVGLFFYIKAQLTDYQHILQTAQCSTTVMQQHLKSNLLEFLCSIRAKLIVFRAIEELKNILDQLDTNPPSQSSSSTSGNVSMSSVSGNTPTSRSLSTGGGDAPAIGFSHLLSNNASSSENSMSPGELPTLPFLPIDECMDEFLVPQHRSSGLSPVQLIQQSIRIYLRSYLQPYEELKKCEQDILEIINQEFDGHLGMIDDQQPFVNTLWLSQCSKTYSSWIHRADKHLKDLNDLNESFRKVSFRFSLSLLLCRLGSVIKHVQSFTK